MGDKLTYLLFNTNEHVLCARRRFLRSFFFLGQRPFVKLKLSFIRPLQNLKSIPDGFTKKILQLALIFFCLSFIEISVVKLFLYLMDYCGGEISAKQHRIHKQAPDASVAIRKRMDLFKLTMNTGRQSNNIFCFCGNITHNFWHQFWNAQIICSWQVNASYPNRVAAVRAGIRTNSVHKNAV